MDELKDVLRVLSSDDFCRKASKEYYERMKVGKEQENNSNKSGRLFGLMAKSRKDSNESNDEEELLRIIFQNNLQSVIGNSALSDSEMEERKIFDLQTNNRNVNKLVDSNGNSSISDLEQILVEAQRDQGDTKSTVVKSRTGFI